MLELGIVVGIGLLAMLAKLPWYWKLTLISHSVITDLAVFSLLIALHWGTFSGVMVATVGALFCSITLSVAGWCIGRFVNGMYVPGKFNVAHKLKG